MSFAARHSADESAQAERRRARKVDAAIANAGLGIKGGRAQYRMAVERRQQRNESEYIPYLAGRHNSAIASAVLLDWPVRGRCNYYSDNPAFDLNGEGIADTTYRSNNLMDQVIWRAPPPSLCSTARITAVRLGRANDQPGSDTKFRTLPGEFLPNLCAVPPALAHLS